MGSKCYQMGEVIGIGLRSVVYKAYCISKQFCVVAIKIIEFQNSVEDMEMKMVDTQKSGANMARVEREARALHTLVTHPNILRPHGMFTVGTSLWVVMPFLSGGSLLSIMADSGHGLSEECIAPLLKGICSALCYLHQQGQTHEDVKPGNILLDSDGSVKLGDLGLSASVCGSSDLETSPYWLAPEVLSGERDWFVSDIWSLGITALELAHGRPPLSHLHPCKSFIKGVNRRFGFVDRFHINMDDDEEEDNMDEGSSNRKKKDKDFSSCFKNLVALCLNSDPLKRPSAEKLMEHELFNKCQGPDLLKHMIRKEIVNNIVRKRVASLRFETGGDYEVMNEKLDLAIAMEERKVQRLMEDALGKLVEKKKRRQNLHK